MAEAAFRPPQFSPKETNACEVWRSFKEDLNVYFEAADLAEAAGARKVAILLYCMGSKYRKVNENFTMTEDQKKDYNYVVGQFDQYFEPKKVTKLYMKKFDNCRQGPNETISEYVTNLKEIAKYCEFAGTIDRQLCKQISDGVRDPGLRDKLWSEELTLEQIITKCHLHEQKKESFAIIKPSAYESRDILYYNTDVRGRGRGRSRGRGSRFTSRGRGGSHPPSHGYSQGYSQQGSRGRGSHRGSNRGVSHGFHSHYPY